MSGSRDDRVLAFTRGLSWVIAPVLVLAFVLLWPVPTDTGQRFAWSIRPTLTPMVLASAYLGGAYFFVRAGTTRGWHTVRGGFVPVTLFATLLGMATVIHWENFTHSSPAFWLWAALYFTAPVLVGCAFWANEVHSLAPDDREVAVPVPVARAVAGVGALALATGLFLFVLPGVAIPIWPWALSPLTARVVGAVFCLGVAGLGVLVDRRWSSARIPVQVGIGMVVVMVISGARAHAELLLDRPLAWAFIIGFPLLVVVQVVWYVAMERRAREMERRAREGSP